jgi:hypothetical protein
MGASGAATGTESGMTAASEDMVNLMCERIYINNCKEKLSALQRNNILTVSKLRNVGLTVSKLRNNFGFL